MNNRNEIKWQPFNAIIGAEEVIRELQIKRNYKQMPILSEDELLNLEVLIKKAFHTKEKIQVFICFFSRINSFNFSSFS